MGGFLSGQVGESLFREPLHRWFKDNPLPELFRKTADLEDDRLLAVITSLIVEQRVDVLLGSFLPRYKRLADPKEFTFSMKIGLVEALAFIPPRIPRAATVIRQIRNEFAHDLDIDSFDRLKPKIISELKNLRVDIDRQCGAEEIRPKASLVEESKAENEAQLRALVAEGPISVEIRGGNRIERYSGGVVKIIALPR